MKFLFVSFYAVFLLTFAVQAQSQIEGSISTAGGEESNIIVIKMTHQDQSELSKSITVEAADYFFLGNLADGSYQLEVRSDGFEPILISDFSFPRDADQVLGLMMRPIQTFGVTRNNDYNEQPKKQMKLVVNFE